MVAIFQKKLWDCTVYKVLVLSKLKQLRQIIFCNILCLVETGRSQRCAWICFKIKRTIGSEGAVNRSVKGIRWVMDYPRKRYNAIPAYHRKSKRHFTRGITPKRVTSGGTHLRGLAPRQRSSEKTSQRWRAVGDIVRFDRPRNRSLGLPHR